MTHFISSCYHTYTHNGGREQGVLNVNHVWGVPTYLRMERGNARKLCHCVARNRIELWVEKVRTSARRLEGMQTDRQQAQQ